jgi:hypothetical protein
MKMEDLCCHEATVLKFTKYSTSIKLHLKDVHIGHQKADIELLFDGIKKLEIDNKPDESPLMAAEDGEVFTLDFEDSKVELLIEWNDFIRHVRFVRFYFIECEEIFIKILEHKTWQGEIVRKKIIE